MQLKNTLSWLLLPLYGPWHHLLAARFMVFVDRPVLFTLNLFLLSDKIFFSSNNPFSPHSPVGFNAQNMSLRCWCTDESPMWWSLTSWTYTRRSCKQWNHNFPWYFSRCTEKLNTRGWSLNCCSTSICKSLFLKSVSQTGLLGYKHGV